MKQIYSWKVVIFLIGLISFSPVWDGGCPALANDLKFGPEISLYNFYDVCYLEGKAWAVGNYGIIIFSDDGGRNWTLQKSGVDKELYSVWFVTADCGWIFGRSGIALKTTDGGKTWVKLDLNVVYDISSCIFLDENTGWIVCGRDMLILHTDDGGNTWIKQIEDGEDAILSDIYFCDKDFGWVAGEFGIILHTQDGGKTWKKQDSPLGDEVHLFGIRFFNRERGWTVGGDGAILSTNDGGATWVSVNSSYKETLYRVKIVGNKLFATGFKGPLLVNRNIDNEKISWDKIRTGCFFWMRGLAFTDEQDAILTGGNGNIFYSKDGGETWTLAELLKK